MISKLKVFKLMKWSNKHMCLLNFILFSLKKIQPNFIISYLIGLFKNFEIFKYLTYRGYFT